MVPATCCFEEISWLSKSKMQIQSSCRRKQPLISQGVVAVVMCLCMILVEHNTAPASHSCSGHCRGKSLDKTGYERFPVCPFPFPFTGKLLLRKDHGSEIDNTLPVWTPCWLKATCRCMMWGIRRWRQLSKAQLKITLHTFTRGQKKGM